MKRARDLYPKLISDGNLMQALREVNKSHRWVKHHRKNKLVEKIEADMPGYVIKLREVIETGFHPAPCRKLRRYDKSAEKWRDISEPALWPDQYVHHALIQVLEPVMMRGMDKYCCGSIKGRGIHYGTKAIKRWREDEKQTRWCAELDIKHFYDNLNPQCVVDRFKKLIKDHRVLSLIESIVEGGIIIGGFCSQWWANVTLQPTDQAVHQEDVKYIRYIDNFTIFAYRKRTIQKAINIVREELAKMGLELKGNWQKFKTSDRLPTALGYRYGHRFTLLRKRNLLRLKRQLARYYKKVREHRRVPISMALGLLSRLGQLRHFNSRNLYKRLLKPKTQKALKNIVRAYARKERLKWNTSLASCNAMA